MFFHQCTTYPLCDYTEEQLINLQNDIKGPHYVDKIYSYTFDDISYKESPISSTQNLIIIECFQDSNLINAEEDFCNFETYVTDDTQQIILDEGEHFYKHIHGLEVDKYLVNLKGGYDDYIVTHELDIKKLRKNAIRSDKILESSNFNPKPPGFRKNNVKKRYDYLLNN